MFISMGLYTIIRSTISILRYATLFLLSLHVKKVVCPLDFFCTWPKGDALRTCFGWPRNRTSAWVRVPFA